jgi:hypothetical protein
MMGLGLALALALACATDMKVAIAKLGFEVADWLYD